ncbi:MAG: glycoside hydrolase family 28 protein [Bryobacterales bacterium]|nr:glycoside hydrolase family 28 protein [Bryobacterales bacterium]
MHRRSFLLSACGAAYAAGRTFDILEYGAKAGGGALNTDAIQKAIDACALAGGGRVVVPSGTFLTGGVVLKDRVDLHLSDGAVLLGSPRFRDYAPHQAKSRARYERYLQTSLLFAQGAHGISVSGKGALNGNSKAGNDFINKDRIEKHRPCLIWFDECTNVTVRDVTFMSSGFWTETYTRCRNVHVNGITVTDSTFRNNDGCNIVDCENAVVENCTIDALDDGICLKGYTADGCKNVVIRNNRVRSLCNGIKAGTDSSGGFQNVLIEDNVVWQTGIAGLALELVDGGAMRNLVVRNLKMDVVETPIFLKLGDRNRPIYTPNGDVIPETGRMEDIHISGIRATVNDAEKYSAAERAIHNYVPYASSITGIPGRYIERVTLRDIEIEILGGFPPGTEEDARRAIPENSRTYPENRMFGILPAYAFYIRHARNISMENVSVKMRQPDARPAMVLDDVHDSTLRGIKPVRMESNCSGVKI